MEKLESYENILIPELRRMILNNFFNVSQVECVVLKSGMAFANALFAIKTETQFNQHFLDWDSEKDRITLIGLYPDSIKNNPILIIDKIFNIKKLKAISNFIKNYNPKSINFVTLVNKATFQGI